ncbi:hypothetical protein [Shewanella marina]|uniref:hypothetical protein n=1 Tax=Shewanella marina TaxID=487319 RepID=UPI0004722CF1|nr:hypothetical protein [Shewanella marina]
MSSDSNLLHHEIKFISINCKVKKYGIELVEEVNLSKDNVDRIIHCGDVNCRSGGFYIYGMINDMFKGNIKQESQKQICNGHEVINGHRQRCMRQFIVSVNIDY